MRKFLLNFNLILFLSIISGQNVVAEVLEKDKLGSVPKGFTSRNTATDLLAQDNLTRVTGVEVIQSESGLELVLETVTGSKRLVPLIIPDGNDLVIEILDATLAFSIRNGVTEINPTPEVDRITIDKIDNNIIQVRIVGRDRPLDAEVVSGEDDLVLSIAPSDAIAETEPDESIDIIATGSAADDDYNVSNATTGTRTDTEIRDIPQSIQVVPQEVLEDQQVIRLDEALRNVSGVTFGGVDIGRGLRFNIRGFDDAPVLRNGFRQVGIRQSFPETANLERVEVLKGPASVLFGEIEPGGVINLATKRPLSEPYYKLQAQFGNRGLIRPSVDLSGPLTPDGKLLYRLNTVYQNSDEIQDYDNDIDRFFISPVVSWQISDRTDLTLELEYLNDDRPASFGVPAFGDEIADIPSLEKLTALKPDLIIGEASRNESNYDLLAQIAPTILFDSRAASGQWQQNLKTMAQALGDDRLAQSAIDSYEKLVADAKAELAPVVSNNPQLLLLATNKPSENMWAVGQQTYLGTLMREIGFQLIASNSDDKAGVNTPVPLETLPQYNDADIVMLLGYDLDPSSQQQLDENSDLENQQLKTVKENWRNNAIAQAMPASQEDRVYFATAYLWLGFNGPIGTELILEQLRDILL